MMPLPLILLRMECAASVTSMMHKLVMLIPRVPSALTSDCDEVAGETCGEPSCVAGLPKYCHVDHDFDYDCHICAALE